jgi:hypothetical protein
MYLPGAVEPFREPDPVPTPRRQRRQTSAREASSVEPSDAQPRDRPSLDIDTSPDPTPNPDAVVVPLSGIRGDSQALPDARGGGGGRPGEWLGVRSAMPEIDRPERNIREGPSRPPPGSGLRDHGFKPNGDGTFSYVDPMKRCGKPPRPCFRAKLHKDGRITFRKTVQPMGPPGLAAILNRQKAELLEATRELRFKMAAKFAREQLDRRLNGLRHEIGGLWARASLSEARRREMIFERWDECEEPGESKELPGFGKLKGSELDQARVDSGREARATIERWIRKKLPKGSAQAYSEHELRLLNNKRVSKQKFSPYK